MNYSGKRSNHRKNWCTRHVDDKKQLSYHAYLGDLRYQK